MTWSLLNGEPPTALRTDGQDQGRQLELAHATQLPSAYVLLGSSRWYPSLDLEPPFLSHVFCPFESLPLVHWSRASDAMSAGRARGLRSRGMDYPIGLRARGGLRARSERIYRRVPFEGESDERSQRGLKY